MNKQDKELSVAAIKEKLENASSIYLTDFSGLTVEETNAFRDDLFNAKVDYKVLKNTLIKKALESGSSIFCISANWRADFSSPLAIAASANWLIMP